MENMFNRKPQLRLNKTNNLERRTNGRTLIAYFYKKISIAF